MAKRPGDGRWRIIGTAITFTERDENLAIARFHEITAKMKGTTSIDIPMSKSSVGDSPAALKNVSTKKKRITIRIPQTVDKPSPCPRGLLRTAKFKPTSLPSLTSAS